MHVYLHVPFCVRRCSYCDFSIAVRRRLPAQEYVDCVLREVKMRDVDARDELDTLYLGGGPLSPLPGESVALLVSSLLDAFPSTPLRDVVEVTVEANPED